MVSDYYYYYYFIRKGYIQVNELLYTPPLDPGYITIPLASPGMRTRRTSAEF